MEKYIYQMDECPKSSKHLLGSKGNNCAEMIKLGIPVPHGFIITTRAHAHYMETGKLSTELKKQIREQMDVFEKRVGKKFGCETAPLLVSVRSGSAVSMPGMMDTILNIGITPGVEKTLARLTNNTEFARDVHKRFKVMYKKTVGTTAPAEPFDQLLGAVEAVFKSWNCPRAHTYRSLHNIPEDLGTAVTVQMMVFGNLGTRSGTGVVFTRNPSTGERELYGEYLNCAQGEDIVAGTRTPVPVSELKKIDSHSYECLERIARELERNYKDMQDIEFTIEDGTLYILQTRKGQRTAFAGLKIAVDLVNDGKLTIEDALLTIDANMLGCLFHPTFKRESLATATPLTAGLAASPGAACGRIALTSRVAKESKHKTILVREETCADDIEGMHASVGILTARGGMTSHAAVVARGMGKPCVAGCATVSINDADKTCTINGQVFAEGDVISLDGTTGLVYCDEIETQRAQLPDEFTTVMKWADGVRRMRVRANADTPEDAAKSVELGAEGIGLVRTEHMFFDPARLVIMREMITAQTRTARVAALDKLLPMQRADFVGIFRAMDGRPVTVRLVDPPLHEFAPDIEHLREFNPMLGHRGVRLLVTYPEIAAMQTRAVIEAAIETGATPEIMIPLVVGAKEFNHVRAMVRETADAVIKQKRAKTKYQIGTMIETPRACLCSGEIAKQAEFFSFGTNDLTQMTFGFSRDDSGSFLPEYCEKKIIETDPFVRLDTSGLGELLKMSVTRGRQTRPDLKIGICGEHGGEVSSINFFNEIGLDYVSCSPFRIPTARLAAAQAHINHRNKCC
ncbi:MAG: pyruvate, phosphate dikinase [Firmicutes bacterium]|nr:pyruvate, phosphate dikinase [Bacillota bacterium]